MNLPLYTKKEVEEKTYHAIELVNDHRSSKANFHLSQRHLFIPWSHGALSVSKRSINIDIEKKSLGIVLTTV